MIEVGVTMVERGVMVDRGVGREGCGVGCYSREGCGVGRGVIVEGCDGREGIVGRVWCRREGCGVGNVGRGVIVGRGVM